MKKFFALCVSAMLCSAAYALNPVLTVNGENVDKTVTSLTFDGDNVVVHFGDEAQSYDMEAVTITFPTSGIADVEFFRLNSLVGNVITVDGATDGAVEVYTLSGAVCAASVAVDGKATVDVSALPAGAYILRSGKQCVKFVKR